jgi:predicted Zn finger-like uncharacterized protein
MIIQCGQCRTKFRFADDLMEGEGVWMRCSHCQHVFFQDNPQTLKPLGTQEGSLFPEETTPAKASVAGGDEDVAHFLDDILNTKNASDKDLFSEIGNEAGTEYSEDDHILSTELLTAKDQKKTGKFPSKRLWKVLTIVTWVVFVIIVIPAIIYYFIFPQIGDRLLKVVNQYVDIGVREPVRPEIVVGQVKLQDIRQRMLNNYILGSIRIVEGTAVNQADYPISRIVIKGEIVDAYAVVLGELATYAGNVLTDEELTTLPEEAIFTKLSRPEGSNNANDKIVPNGMIPFMIVFIREPAGVIKTTVKTVGAERLLSN